MTNEEAIGCLDLIKTDATRINEAIDIAIEALEKQVARKPTINEWVYPDGLDYSAPVFCMKICCGKCGNEISSGEIGIEDVSFIKFCSECGQKIDWNIENSTEPRKLNS